MNKNIFKKIALLLFVVTTLYACKQDGLDLFERAPDVYFTALINETPPNPRANDSVIVRFFYVPASEMFVHIPISVTGRLSNIDRRARIVANSLESTAVAGVHYKLPPFNPNDIDYGLRNSVIIRAGRAVDTLVVHMLRDPSLSLFGEELVLVLELEPNEYFGTDFRTFLNINTQQERNLIRYKIYVSDIIVQPTRWMDVWFGEFSAKKLLLICELAGFSPAYLDAQYMMDGSYIQPWEVRSAAIITKAYLDAEAAAGRPVYEDRIDMITGLPVRMTMGPGI